MYFFGLREMVDKVVRIIMDIFLEIFNDIIDMC